MSTDTEVIDARHAVGYRRTKGRFFRHCLRDLGEDLPQPRLPDGYRVRGIHPGETAERAAVHGRHGGPNASPTCRCRRPTWAAASRA
jgi:hypothetical protein